MVAALGLMTLVASGCSALRFGYGHADTYAFRWLDSYVGFDEAQAPRVVAALDAWFAWHRATQVPDYAEFLGRIDQAVIADTTAERVCGWWDEVKGRIDLGVEQALPAVVDVAVTLQPAQLANIERRQAKGNKEYRDDFLQADPSKRMKEAVKRVVSRAESLYGGIDDAQRARIAAWVAQSPFDPQLALLERQRRQQELIELLQQVVSGRIGADRLPGELRTYRDRLQRAPVESARAQGARLLEYNCRLAADIHNMTTPAQRQVASRKLKGWVTDLRAIAAPAG